VSVKLGKWDAMEKSARKIVELNPEAASLMRLANVLANKPTPDYKGAAENYEAALRLDPKSGSAWFELAQVKMNLGDVEGAVAAADQAAEIVHSMETRLLAARVRLEREQYDPAAESIAKLIIDETRDDSIRAQAYAILGGAQLKAGNAGIAADTFAKANVQLKDNPEFQYWYGIALIKRNELDMAKAHLKAAVELGRNAATQTPLVAKLTQKAIDEVEKMEPGYAAKLPDVNAKSVGTKDPLIRPPVMMSEKPVIRKVLPPLIEDDGPQLIPTDLEKAK